MPRLYEEGIGARKYISGFEGTQAVPALPSGKVTSLRPASHYLPTFFLFSLFREKLQTKIY
jgi:hypothetical protein